ncbi:hypothetical protein GPECTOR_12g428 [Gonium pectorale]|uniref:RRM domain-containing protein n=1 Tax=Gonium pectorale TaxID=33097 RepID=A0A150GNV3_GONPE|nr:hypothetical protein GPECTOR_12g428 [Gonium pectorale]|eukprot:KXZ51465.1 hypothetical protein GPECTOR_12g428 [Gonium pectorale]
MVGARSGYADADGPWTAATALADIIAAASRAFPCAGPPPPPDLERSLVAAATAVAQTAPWPQAAAMLDGLLRMGSLGTRYLSLTLERVAGMPVPGRLPARGHGWQASRWDAGTTRALPGEAPPSATDSVSLLRSLCAVHALPDPAAVRNTPSAIRRLMAHLTPRLRELPGPGALVPLLADLTSCGLRLERHADHAFLMAAGDYLCEPSQLAAAPSPHLRSDSRSPDSNSGGSSSACSGGSRVARAAPQAATSISQPPAASAALGMNGADGPPALLALTPSQLMSVLDSFVRAGVNHPRLVAAALSSVERCMTAFTPSQLARVAGMVGRYANYRHTLMRRLALHIGGHMPAAVAPADVTVMVEVLARSGVREERFLGAVAAYGAQHAEALLAEAQLKEAQRAEALLAEAQHKEAQHAEARMVEAQHAEAHHAEALLAEAHHAELQAAEGEAAAGVEAAGARAVGPEAAAVEEAGRVTPAAGAEEAARVASEQLQGEGVVGETRHSCAEEADAVRGGHGAASGAHTEGLGSLITAFLQAGAETTRIWEPGSAAHGQLPARESAGGKPDCAVCVERIASGQDARTGLVLGNLPFRLEPYRLLDRLQAIPGAVLSMYYMPYDFAAVGTGSPGLGVAYVGVATPEAAAAIVRRLQAAPILGMQRPVTVKYMPASTPNALLSTLLSLRQPHVGYVHRKSTTHSRPVLLYVSGGLRGQQLSLIAHSMATLSFHSASFLDALARIMLHLLRPALADPSLAAALLPPPAPEAGAKRPSFDAPLRHYQASGVKDTTAAGAPAAAAAAAAASASMGSGTQAAGAAAVLSSAAAAVPARAGSLPPLKSALHTLHALASAPDPDALACRQISDVCAAALRAWLPPSAAAEVVAAAAASGGHPPPSPPPAAPVPHPLSLSPPAALPPHDVLDIHVRLLAQALTAAADHGPSRLAHPPLCAAASGLLRCYLPLLRPRAACALLAALVRLRQPAVDRLVRAVAPLLTQPKQLERLSAQALVSLAWACARTGLAEDAGVVGALAERTSQLLSELPTSGAVQMFWALNVLGYADGTCSGGGSAAADDVGVVAESGGGRSGGLYGALLQLLSERYDLGARDLLLLQEAFEVHTRAQAGAAGAAAAGVETKAAAPSPQLQPQLQGGDGGPLEMPPFLRWLVEHVMARATVSDAGSTDSASGHKADCQATKTRPLLAAEDSAACAEATVTVPAPSATSCSFQHEAAVEAGKALPEGPAGGGCPQPDALAPLLFSDQAAARRTLRTAAGGVCTPTASMLAMAGAVSLAGSPSFPAGSRWAGLDRALGDGSASGEGVAAGGRVNADGDAVAAAAWGGLLQQILIAREGIILEEAGGLLVRLHVMRQVEDRMRRVFSGVTAGP